jgi:hypothetical protein
MINKRKLLYLVCFLVFTYFAQRFFKEESLRYKTFKEGVITEAVVNKRPKCGRGPALAEILIEKRIYKITINVNDCINGVYKIGDKIEVLFCKECDTAILPFYSAKTSYWISVVFFIVPLYFLIILIGPFSKK